MEELKSLPIPEEVKCRCCKTVAEDNDLFCPNCAYPLQGTEEEQSTFIGQYITRKNEQEEWKRQVKNAKVTMIVLACISFFLGIVYFSIGGSEGIILFVIQAIVAAIYGFLAYWSEKTPFGAILTGLIIYISLHLLYAFEDPSTISKGVIIKVVIISYMIKGVASAAKVRNLS